MNHLDQTSIESKGQLNNESGSLSSRKAIFGHPIHGVYFREGPTGQLTKVKNIRVLETAPTEPGGVKFVLSSSASRGWYMQTEPKGRPLAIFLEPQDAENLARELLRQIGKPLEDLEASSKAMGKRLKRLQDCAKSAIANLSDEINRK